MSISGFILMLCTLSNGGNDPPLLLDHGPGTSAGGLNVVSAELLRKDGFSLGFRFDFTQFERLSPGDIDRKTHKVSGSHAHLDALRWSFLETVDLAFGASDEVQLGLSFGTYRGNELREGHIHGNGSYGFHEFGDVSGMTDMLFTVKTQLSKGPGGRWAVIAGIEFPTGRDDVRGNGETDPLEPSVQPGNGTFDVMVGLSHSRWLSEDVTLDASAQYTLRTEEDAFKIGDRIDLGIAVAVRLSEATSPLPRFSLFGELSTRYLFRNEEDGENVRNSGGTVVYLSPGLKIMFSEKCALWLAPQVPLIQALHDEQQSVAFKFAFGLTFTL